MRSVEYPFAAIIPGPLKPGMVAPFRVTSRGQKDIFKDYSHLIIIVYKKAKQEATTNKQTLLRNNYTKNVNI